MLINAKIGAFSGLWKRCLHWPVMLVNASLEGIADKS